MKYNRQKWIIKLGSSQIWIPIKVALPQKSDNLPVPSSACGINQNINFDVGRASKEELLSTLAELHQDNLSKAYLRYTCWNILCPFHSYTKPITDLPAKHLYANCPYTTLNQLYVNYKTKHLNENITVAQAIFTVVFGSSLFTD